jgi:hypothetical protein
MIEVKDVGDLIATVENFRDFRKGLSFAGTRDDFLQIGKFRYDTNHLMRDHRHIKRYREATVTQEALVVFQGTVEARVFGKTGFKPVQIIKLVAGDIFTLYGGGVGFTVLEDDTIMAEFKNGPYDVESDDEDRELI